MKKLLLLFVVLIAFDVNAQTLELKNGKYYQDGKLFSGVYKESATSEKQISEMAIKKGLLEGESVYYYENGNKSELRSYKKGLKHGTWYTWDQQGNKTAEACYKKDLKEGKWYIWDEKGQKRYEMNYIKGEKEGTWYMWDEKGTLTMEKTY